MGQSPVVAASPAAATDKAAEGDKPEDKFIASVAKNFKATGSKTRSISLAVGECGNAAHQAFVNSGKRLEFKRD